MFDLQGARRAAKALLLVPVDRSLAMLFNVGNPGERRRAEAQAMKNDFVAPLLTPTRDELQSVEAQGADVRAEMAATLTEGLGRRLLAVCLLLLGIACGTIANLL